MTAVCACFFLLPGAELPAVAQAPASSPGSITWSVGPANTSGPDGRRAIDLELAGGQKVTEHIAVTNHSTRAVLFDIDANDGYLTRNGLFDIQAADREPTDGGSWITVPEAINITGGATVVVPITISVPTLATPGDHPAGVTATLATTSGQVRVQNRVGVRINTRVTGAYLAKLAIADVRVSYDRSWNPFRPGSVDVRYTVTSNSNVRVATANTVEAAGPLGSRALPDNTSARTREILPGGTREFTARVTGQWPLWKIKTTISATPTAIGDELTDLRPVTVTVTRWSWALPVAQLLLAVLLVLSILVAAAIRGRRGRRGPISTSLESSGA